MKRFLTLKHWQIFLIMVISSLDIYPVPFNEILLLISVITGTIWIYTIGTYGQKQVVAMGLPALNMNLFKTNVLLLTIFSIILVFVDRDILKEAATIDNWQGVLIMVMILYFCVSALQAFVFVCKTLKTIELKREVFFDDYVKSFFGMIFIFIGIWFIQPKVNRLLGNKNLAPQIRDEETYIGA